LCHSYEHIQVVIKVNGKSASSYKPTPPKNSSSNSIETTNSFKPHQDSLSHTKFKPVSWITIGDQNAGSVGRCLCRILLPRCSRFSLTIIHQHTAWYSRYI
jgi:hypothetical protein